MLRRPRSGFIACRTVSAKPKRAKSDPVLRDRIVSGDIGRGRRLPNQNELAAAHRVSRVTIRRALAELERERLIERRRSLGTRVIFRPSAAPIVGDISGMMASLADMGRRTTVKLLSFDYIAAEGGVAEALGVTAPDLIQRAVRVRAIDGEPFSYLTTHVPGGMGRHHFFMAGARQPSAARIAGAFRRQGEPRHPADQRARGPAAGTAIGVATGSPLIELTRVVYDERGRAVEHLHALYRPDRYSLKISLERSGKPNQKTWAPAMRARPRKSKSTIINSVIS